LKDKNAEIRRFGVVDIEGRQVWIRREEMKMSRSVVLWNETIRRCGVVNIEEKEAKLR
jgi:hypothetical protein